MAQQYYQVFLTTDFYKAHNKKLEQYKIFFPEFDCNLNKIVRKMWIGDSKYIQ